MKHIKIIIFTHFLVCLFCWGKAQTITVTPAFPTVDDTVTIVYDATLGNGALTGVSPIYIHTGLITSNSISPTDWKYVQLLPWPTNNPKLLMTSLGNNKHQIKYHIRTFYNFTSTSEIASKMAFVFRNAAGTIVGKDAINQDIYYDLYSGSSVQVGVSTPSIGSIYALNASVNVSANASANGDLSLYINNNLVQSASGTNQVSYTTTASTAGTYWVKVVYENGGTTVMDSVYYIVQGQSIIQSPPTGTIGGVLELSSTSVRVVLNTPVADKEYVYLLGDFNNYLAHPDYAMKRSGDGRFWWIELTGLNPSQEYGYQFLVKNNGGETIIIGDPFAKKILDPWNDSFIPPSVYPNLKPYPVGKTAGIVSVFQTNMTAYNWQVTNFAKPSNTDLVVYELLIRDFSKRHSFQALIDSFWYLKSLGVNTIELMPVMEFEGNSSWGYNPMYMFAVDKYYGTQEKLKEFIDLCHENGMAVVLDIVLNHQFGLSPMVNLYWDAAQNKPAVNNPWFNPDAKHPFNVGYDMNHNSTETRSFVDRVLRYWVEEFKVDGFRFDLSKGFTQFNSGSDVGLWGQYDASRIANLKRMSDEIRQVDNSTMLILEHFSENSEEKELADYGFMTWGKMNCPYNQSSMGHASGPECSWDISGVSYKSRNFNNPNLVGYMESHDEERLMFKNLSYGNASGGYDIKDLNTSIDRMGQVAALFFAVPGPKMIWQFEEVGYDVSIDVPCRVCEKPIKWDYFTDMNRNRLYQIYSALVKLKTSEPAFETTNFTQNVSGQVKQVQLTHPSCNVNVFGNFGVAASTSSISFQNSGKWYDYLTGDSISISSSNPSITLQPGEYHVYTTKKFQTPDLSYNVTSTDDQVFEKIEHTAFPNPFTEEIHIRFFIPQREVIIVEILDLTGRVIRSFGAQSDGSPLHVQEVIWDGTDSYARKSTPGTYLYRITTPQKAAYGKILLMY